MYVSCHTDFLLDSFLAFAGEVMLMIIIGIYGSHFSLPLVAGTEVLD